MHLRRPRGACRLADNGFMLKSGTPRSPLFEPVTWKQEIDLKGAKAVKIKDISMTNLLKAAN